MQTVGDLLAQSVHSALGHASENWEVIKDYAKGQMPFLVEKVSQIPQASMVVIIAGTAIGVCLVGRAFHLPIFRNAYVDPPNLSRKWIHVALSGMFLSLAVYETYANAVNLGCVE